MSACVARHLFSFKRRTMIHPRLACPNDACKMRTMPMGASYCPYCGTKLVQVFDKTDENSDILWKNDLSLEMVKVEGGEFYLGGEEHLILGDFLIGKFQVTQSLWRGVMGETAHLPKKNMAMDGISWDQTHVFLEKLNLLTKKNYRLPTEAEWEFAAKGGNHSRGHWYAGGDKLADLGWYEDNSEYEVHEVGLKAPNELNLYDMSGNVWECCEDDYEKQLSNKAATSDEVLTNRPKVCRGGSCFDSQESAQVEYRKALYPTKVEARLGLRLAMTPEFTVLKL